MRQSLEKIPCSKCQADNYSSAPVCWQCGQPMKQRNTETQPPSQPYPNPSPNPPVYDPRPAQTYGAPPGRPVDGPLADGAPPMAQSAPEENAGIMSKKIGGKLLLMTILLGLYSLQLMLGLVVSVILLIGTSSILTLIPIAVYVSLLYSAFSLWWHGDGNARQRFVRLMSFGLGWAVYRLILAYGVRTAADTMTTADTIALTIQWMQAIFSAVLLWYLSTGEVKEYCCDWG